MKKNNKIILTIILLIIGFILGFFTNFFIIKMKSNSQKSINNYADTTFITSIKDSGQTTEKVNEMLDEITKLSDRLIELECEKDSIESQIITLKNRINNSTNFKYENEIYPED